MSAFTISAGVCTTATYTMTNSDGTALDSSVFTFSGTTMAMSVYTTDITKIGTYTLMLIGTLDNVISTSKTFTVTILDQCYG